MGDIPEYMKEDGKQQMRQSMQENPALWIAAAEFASDGGFGWEERLTVLAEAKNLEKIKTVDGWRSVICDYEKYDLNKGGTNRSENWDRPIRAFYVKTAIERLLQLVKAPQAVLEDFQTFFQSQPVAAKKRGELQRVLIEQPDLKTPAALAVAAGCDLKLVKRYLKDGSVVRLP